MNKFCDYIVYADESGDHGLKRSDPEFPVFCLAFVVVKKTDYIEQLVPSFQKIKFDFWGHDRVVFHEHDIRKQKLAFNIFKNDLALRNEFLQRINVSMEKAPFSVISAVIKKDILRKRYTVPFSPYDLALRFCLEKLLKLMRSEDQLGKRITIIFERRGSVEDQELANEFNSIIAGHKLGFANNPSPSRSGGFGEMDFQMLFAGKEHNCTGMQLADLIARPIALNVLRPDQNNRAYSIIRHKYPAGIQNKIFPR